jgi:hypothetical protein
LRRLYRTFDHPGGCTLHGKHLDKDDFMRLWEGEVYPGTFLHRGHNDQWWIDFAELAEDRVERKSTPSRELREAIHIARSVLREYQGPPERQGWMSSMLVEAGLPIDKRTLSARYRLDAGLTRE